MRQHSMDPSVGVGTSTNPGVSRAYPYNRGYSLHRLTESPEGSAAKETTILLTYRGIGPHRLALAGGAWSALRYALSFMARFGRQHRNMQRRQTREQIDIAEQAFFVKPDLGCEELRQVVELDDQDFRLSQRLVSHEGKLVEYALVLSRLQGGQWVEVYSIDTEHGMLHEHISGHSRKDDRRDISPLYTQVDVQESLDDPAMQLVLEKYRRMRS